MDCRTCDDLVAAYTSAVDLYTTAVRDIGTLAGDDFRLAFKDAERLRLACCDADHALIAHFRQDHPTSLPQSWQ
jgi:hypothetical protein